ncbi:MAG: ABC transporter substrate-binding protein [Gammaproteobacteria bacterium]|nr:ABC transporter substrate-binding protein [Gammaproteobacteria bacterium]
MIHSLFKTILIFIILFTLSACMDKPMKKLKIGISPWPGYEPLMLGLEKNLYGDLDLRIIRFATPSESFKALRDGAIDMAAFTIDEAFHYVNEDEEMPSVLLILDISYGGDAIVAHPKIKSLSDLKGKRVGVEESALGDYMINRALDFTNNVMIKDISLLNFEMGKQVQAYIENKADAFVTYEPFKTALLKEGAHVIFDSKQIPNEIIDVLVTNQKDIDSKKEVFKQLINGWFLSLEYIKKHPQESMKIMASYENISVESFTNAYNDLIIPSRQDNMNMLKTDGILKQPMDRLYQLMKAKGTMDKEIDINALLNNILVKEK